MWGISSSGALQKAGCKRPAGNHSGRSDPADRIDRLRRALETAALGLLLFALYAAGASRTIYVGDSGELVAAVHTLGIPHPTGYPLYVLAGKLWTLVVPLGTIAFRMSLFSAACAAAAAGTLYATGRRLGLEGGPALFGALLLAFSPSFWAEANVQRVYSLNALFLVAALGAAAAWHRSRRPRHFVLTVFLSALGAANHTFMAFFALAFVGWALAADRSALARPRTWLAAAGAGAAGVAPYLYLPLRSRADPPLDWGDPESLKGFLDVVLRRDFWGRAWIEGPLDLVPIAADYARGIAEELGWLGVVFVVAGAGWAWRWRAPADADDAGRSPAAASADSVDAGRHTASSIAALLVATMAVNLGTMALHGSRSDLFVWHRYYIPSYLTAALLAALGCQALWDRLSRARLSLSAARSMRAARWAVLALPAILLVLGYPRFDRSRYRIAEDYSRTLLDSVPPGAHLVASDDNILFVLLYLQLVEGLRPDVDLVTPGVAGAAPPELRFDPDDDPLFLTHHPNWSLPQLEVVPVGLVFRTVRRGAPLPAPIVAKTELEGEHDPRVPKDHLTRNLIGELHYMLGVTFERRDWPRAAAELARASARAPDNDVLHYNLGLIYRRNGLFERALAAFERAAAINPRHLASNDRVKPSDRVAELRPEVERLRAIEQAIAALPEVAAAPAESAERHLRIAAELERRGESLAAAGHRLRAQEVAVPAADQELASSSR